MNERGACCCAGQVSTEDSCLITVDGLSVLGRTPEARDSSSTRACQGAVLPMLPILLCSDGLPGLPAIFSDSSFLMEPGRKENSPFICSEPDPWAINDRILLHVPTLLLCNVLTQETGALSHSFAFQKNTALF